MKYVIIGICALLAIVAPYFWPDHPWIYYICKPLTTILILLVAIPTPNTRYKIAIVIGLLFSLMGDIFLMLPSDQFIAGLICFLITHICYIVGFLSDSRFGRPLRPYISLAIVAVFIYSGISHNIAGMKIPVAIYAAALCLMTSQAMARNSQNQNKSSLLAMLGAILFLISDTLLAYDRFVFVFEFGHLAILGTYYAAQYLIARSTAQSGKALDPPLQTN